MDNAALGDTPRRVLILLPNWLGDVVMTTPLLDHLHQAFAAATPSRRPSLHLAVRRPWADLFAADPRVADRMIIERNGRHGGVGGIWRQAVAMRRGRHDAVIVCPPSLRSGLAAALSRIPLRVGYVGDGRGLLLKPGLVRSPRGQRHYSREMLGLAEPLLAAWEIAAPPPAPASLPLSSLPGCDKLAAVPVGDGGSRPVWAVAPGTTYGEAKTWPLVQMTRFVDLAVSEHGARVVLLGDRQVADFVAAMRRASDRSWTTRSTGAGEVVDLTGRTDLGQVVGILKRVEAFVGNDSGLMHLAGALGVPTVGIFGSSNPAWTRPLGRRTAAVVAEGFACQPCYRQTCNQPRFCLETVTAEAVLQKVRELLATPSAPSEEG